MTGFHRRRYNTVAVVISLLCECVIVLRVLKAVYASANAKFYIYVPFLTFDVFVALKRYQSKHVVKVNVPFRLLYHWSTVIIIERRRHTPQAYKL